MSVNSSPELISLFETALNEFEKRTRTNLFQHQIIDSLANCESADDIIDILQQQVQALHKIREESTLIKWLKRTVRVIHALSTNDIIREHITLPFPPAKAIFAGLGILLAAIKDINTSYDALIDLFESFESFIRRLDIYTKVPSTTAMTEIIIKILIELLSTISLAIQQVKQGRLKKLGKKLLGENDNDVEAVLQRLDRLTQEEARTTVAQTLQVVYGLVKNMTVVMDGAQHGKASRDEIHEALIVMQQLASDMHRSRRDQFQETFRHWLSPPDPSINHNAALRARHKGTAEWFIHGNTFPEWKLTTGSLLWIHGKPGSGKSIISSTVVEDIAVTHKAGLASIALFYFDFKDTSKQGARGAFSSLVIQLAAQSDAYSKILSDLYSIHDSGSKQPSDDALRECLRGMLELQEQGPIFIIFDGLDECPNNSGTPSPRENVLDLVEWLVELHHPHLHLCVTSRPEADIEAVLQPLASHTVSLHNEGGQKDDINKYIKFFINTNRCTRRWRKEDKELVINKLSEGADGMFRWVFCQLDRLRRCLPQRIRKSLDELPETLDETYERTLLDIDEEKRAFAHRLFQCITVACRPLRVEELAEFLTFDFETGGSPIFRADWRSEDPRDTVLSTCSTLISIVRAGGSSVVQFSHFSVKEYLTSNRISEGQTSRYYIPLEPAHIIVTQACLSTLLQLDNHVTEAHMKNFPLAPYAAQYWVEHAKFENVLPQTEDAMKRLFDPRNPHFAAWIWIYDMDPGWRGLSSMVPDTPSSPRASPLYYAALCDFDSVAEWLVKECSQDINERGGFFNTPLYAASVEGSLKVVRLLLKHNAPINGSSFGGWIPLHGASLNAHTDVSRVLLENGANVNASNDNGETPLLVASGNRQEETSSEVARLLLMHGADPNVRDKHGRTPLSVALEQDHVGLAQLLLKHGADLNAQNRYDGETQLHVALRRGRVKVVQRLLELGANVNLRDSQGQIPFHLALEKEQDEIALLILKHALNPNVQDSHGETPFHLALRRRKSLKVVQRLLELCANVNLRDDRGRTPLHVVQNHEIVQILLEHGADPNVRDNYGETPLHVASEQGRLKVVQWLLKFSANVNLRDNKGTTPLHVVQNDEILQALLEHGADPNVQDSYGETPLHVASEQGRLKVVQRLLELGTNVNLRDNEGQTPLQVVQNDEILQVLLEHGADPNVRDNGGETPLHVASKQGRLKVVQRLLELGANVNRRDNSRRTPLHVVQTDEISQVLLEHGADPNVRNNDGETPLHVASEQGKLKALPRLQELGANVNLRDDSRRTPLHIVQNDEISQVLLEHGADPNVRNNDGETPLHVASEQGRLKVVQRLLELGANVNLRDNSRRTPLHTVQNDEILQVFLDHGADPNVRDKDGITPLHVASSQGRPKVVHRLLEAGATVHVRNKLGRTPFQVVRGPYKDEISQLLLEHGAERTYSHGPATESASATESNTLWLQFAMLCLHLFLYSLHNSDAFW